MQTRSPARTLLVLLLLAHGCCGNRANQPEVPIVVSAEYPGASAAEVEQVVVAPLESALMSTAGLRRMESTAVEGEGRVVLWFDEQPEPLLRLATTRDRLEGIEVSLPDEAGPVVIGHGVTPERIPLEWFVEVSGGGAPDAALLDGLVRELQTLPGLEQVLVTGERRPRIEVAVDPHRAAAYGIGPQVFHDSGRAMNGLGRAESLRDLEQMVLAADGPVFVRDVAEVRLGWEETRERVELDGSDGALVSPVMREGEDAEQATTALREAATRVVLAWPDGVTLVEIGGAPDVGIRVEGLGEDIETLLALHELREAATEMGANRELAILGMQREGTWMGPTNPGVASLSWWWEGDPPGNVRNSLHDIALSTPMLAPGRPVLAGDERIRVCLSGPEHDALDRPADDLSNHLAMLDGVRGVWDDRGVDMPAVDIRFDRDALARFGVTQHQALEMLRVAVYGAEMGQVYEGEQRIPVVLRWGEGGLEPDRLRDLRLPLTGVDGAVVPLQAVADIMLEAQPSALHRVDGLPVVTLELVVDAGQEKALRKIILTELPTDLPEGVTVQLVSR